MRFLTLEYIKQHSRLDFDNEDGLLEQYAESAEETICGLLNRGDTVDSMVESLTEQYGEIPANLYEAGQMLVELSYQQRSPVSVQNMSVVPYGFDLKIKRYMAL